MARIVLLLLNYIIIMFYFPDDHLGLVLSPHLKNVCISETIKIERNGIKYI